MSSILISLSNYKRHVNIYCSDFEESDRKIVLGSVDSPNQILQTKFDKFFVVRISNLKQKHLPVIQRGNCEVIGV